MVTYDSDIEPDDLIPAYIESRTRLFEIQRPLQDVGKQKNRKAAPAAPRDPAEEAEVARLEAKIDHIEKDVIFQRDCDVAEQQWRAKKASLEKDYTANRKQKLEEAEEAGDATTESVAAGTQNGVTDEAERIAAEILAENEDEDDDGLADLFASLPVSEVDPDTGKIQTVMNGSQGSRVVIRDFGKWTGVSPVRALEEACRSR